VRDGKIHDPRFVPIIFEHPPEMEESKQHLLVENLAMVNPNLGYSVDREFLEREFKKAENGGEESFRGFLAKHGNVEIGLNLRSDRWAGSDFWESTGADNITLERILKDCEVVDVGIDGGGLDDLLGFCVVGRVRQSHEWMVWAHAWAHPSVMERRKSEASRFTDFAIDGDLTLVKTIGDDVQDVAEIVSEIYRSGLLDKIGVDPHGLGGILEALIEPRGNAVTITKQAAGFAKIDPLMALFNAVSLMSLNPATDQIDQGFVNL
jgi:phage terminase large subunit-like protein